jgi:plastocyanin
MSVAVMITSTGYQPSNVEVSLGESVWWLNEDTRPHSATSDDGKSFETGELDQGESKRIVMTQKGVFGYHDRYGPHHGVVTVN